VRIARYDALGRLVTEVELLNHKRIDAIQCPRRIILRRPVAGVEVKLSLGKIRLNTRLPRSKFMPPQRPGWEIIEIGPAARPIIP